MATDACQYFYDCKGCATVLKPKPGDCCMFCSYGDAKCPPIQAGGCLGHDFGQKRFGDHGYGLEEVVADLCAAMLGAELRVPGVHIDDHASYLASWLRFLDEQPSAFLTAAGKAQQAADYLMGLMGLSVPPDPG